VTPVSFNAANGMITER